MSKQYLSIEQMQHLKKLGVDTSNASMILIYEDGAGYLLDWENVIKELCNPEPMKMFKKLYDVETGEYDYNYDNSYTENFGVFTLQDILDLLPESIEVDEDEVYELIILSRNKNSVISYSYHLMLCSNSIDLHCEIGNLIDIAYKMLCWCFENGYLKYK